MSPIDLSIICIYCLTLPFIAFFLSGRQESVSAYVGGGHDLPWWVICLSLVATETSTLTVISIPGIAYGDGLVFVGLAIGYVIGRSLVAWLFLPHYFSGQFSSVYQYLGQRFGTSMERTVSVTFLLMRVLAEGIRMFAGMLPVAAILAAMHFPLPHFVVMLIIVGLTLFYTLFGGLRAVVWSDAIQLAVYVTGAAACVFLLYHHQTAAQTHMLVHSSRFHLFQKSSLFFLNPYTPPAAIVGGAIMSMASHGTDQLMVQRILAARNLRDARKALIGSGFMVGGLFTLLSLVGILLWARNGGRPLAEVGLGASDELFPDFIVHGLPHGLAGLLIAGLLSATMGSLSATLNSMTSATLLDFSAFCTSVTKRLHMAPLAFARLVTLAWAAILVLAALGFSHSHGPAVVFGLSVAACSYGAMLGAFVFAMFVAQADVRDVLPAFILTLLVVCGVMMFVHPYGHVIAFSWLVPFGVVLMFAFGTVSRQVRRLRA
ncbi:sodium:solute symporter [Gluconacetobacter entanii]|uniref:sodium:solute symporter n=1 Tax=Gluconacetobacter entanii TaxID=108528 RepID=UPI001C934F58|nr:sodium:solute symporter [Gluconacetobacter entanii]MBY4641145.1 sodium:solute symporter [Gluconacetobacter entanii]MCW4580210.1 sodium:solute symporter [Gluconacetobacter entanii]MCW4583540.1 sodium:solute symporter [Gluconacetobacter entanii]MCW4586886.1 sodium:solute symporter [Gluconacetobacter entanii]